MKPTFRNFALALCAVALSVVPSGCGHDDGGGGGGSIGENNDRNLVACLGDSITQGYNCIGAPYPSRLAAYSGKNVKNYGVGGVTSSYGVSIVDTVMARKPGYVCILYGANDCVLDVDTGATVGNLRRIVQACKAGGARPILATPTPMNGSHAIFNGRATRLSEAIRAMAKEEGVSLVDLNKAFGDGSKYLNPADGLHMNDAGSDLIARKFNSKI